MSIIVCEQNYLLSDNKTEQSDFDSLVDVIVV